MEVEFEHEISPPFLLDDSISFSSFFFFPEYPLFSRSVKVNMSHGLSYWAFINSNIGAHLKRPLAVSNPHSGHDHMQHVVSANQDTSSVMWTLIIVTQRPPSTLLFVPD